MYIPKVFREDDPEVARALIRANPFATVVSADAGEPFATHLPLLLSEDGGVLRGHLARANPHAKAFAAGGRVLAIFHGPHGYVSPSLYDDQVSVPTWNYGAVHVYGAARPMSDAELDALLEDVVTTFESGRRTPWKLSLPEEVHAKKRAQIAGFFIDVVRVEAKLKLSQNRTPEERARIIGDLESQDAAGRELAALMREREPTQSAR